MIEWLTDNAVWIGAVGAIAAVIALFTPLFKKSSERIKVTAKNGSVAIGGNNKGGTITTNKPTSEKQPSDIDA